MARGHEIAIASETGAFEKGIQSGVIEPLEDAEGALKKLGQNTGPEKLEQGLKDAAKASDEMKDEIKRNASQIDSTFRKSDDDFELSNREKRKITKETIKEIGEEAKQNASETFSSFDGSAQSFVDGIQGTLGGLVSSLGPAGIAAGAAGALAIGLIQGALQNADETSQAFKQDVADLTQALIDAGSHGTISTDDMVKALQKLATETDSSKVSLQKLFDTAKASGNSFKDLAQAYAGNEAGLSKLLATAKEKLAVDQKAADANKVSRADQNDMTVGEIQHAAALQKTAAAQKDYVSYLQQSADKAKEAKKAEEEYIQADGPALAAKAAALGNLQSAYNDAADSVEDYVDAETGVFNYQGFLDSMQKKEQALQDLNTNIASLHLTPDALAGLNTMGADAASTLVDAMVHGTDAQKQQAIDVLTKAGQQGGAGFVSGVQSQLPPTITGPSIQLQLPNAQDIVRTMQQRLNQSGSLLLKANVTDKYGRDVG
jgi:DNA repair exonuclease SbcCD ATPase subunit